MLPCLNLYFVICFEIETSFLSPLLPAGKGIRVENFMEKSFFVVASKILGERSWWPLHEEHACHLDAVLLPCKDWHKLKLFFWSENTFK